ncbi:hypothetical protein PFISCL1PPCAC_20800, partial [Pristionchus fissidentatus]
TVPFICSPPISSSMPSSLGPPRYSGVPFLEHLSVHIHPNRPSFVATHKTSTDAAPTVVSNDLTVTAATADFFPIPVDLISVSSSNFPFRPLQIITCSSLNRKTS